MKLPYTAYHNEIALLLPLYFNFYHHSTHVLLVMQQTELAELTQDANSSGHIVLFFFELTGRASVIN